MTAETTDVLLYKIITAEEFPEYMRWHEDVKVSHVLKNQYEIKYCVSGYVRKTPRY